MIRLALCLFLSLGGIALAVPLETPEYNPLHQVPTPDGTVKSEGSGPTDAEIATWMWKRFAGDKPMPPELRKKYGLPAEDPPIPAGR